MTPLQDRTKAHHAPLHIFVPNTVYMVTAGTLGKQHLFLGSPRLRLLEEVLFSTMTRRGWELEAWALFSNHYHWIAKSPISEGDVNSLIKEFHSKSAIALNRHDKKSSRKVWFQYWDTCLTFENSYHARLNYVMQNPAHHGLVATSQQYPFCSANWFAQNMPPAHVRKVESFGTSRLNVVDAFEPAWED